MHAAQGGPADTRASAALAGSVALLFPTVCVAGRGVSLQMAICVAGGGTLIHLANWLVRELELEREKASPVGLLPAGPTPATSNQFLASSCVAASHLAPAWRGCKPCDRQHIRLGTHATQHPCGSSSSMGVPSLEHQHTMQTRIHKAPTVSPACRPARV